MIWPALGVAVSLTIVPVAVEPSPEAPPTGTHSPAPVVPSVGKREQTTGAGLPAVLKCIRWAESRGDYRVVSADGQYRGAFQLSLTYSATWARRYGAARWANLPADRWSRAVQNKVALGLWRDWPGAWAGDGCMP